MPNLTNFNSLIGITIAIILLHFYMRNRALEQMIMPVPPSREGGAMEEAQNPTRHFLGNHYSNEAEPRFCHAVEEINTVQYRRSQETLEAIEL
jgi:hypothetical protein